MFAGPKGDCVVVAVYEAAVVGVAAEDHGVSPRYALAKKAPLLSTKTVAVVPAPDWKAALPPVATVHAEVVQKLAPVGVAIATGDPVPPLQVVVAVQNPYPKKPICHCGGAGLDLERPELVAIGLYVEASVVETPVLEPEPWIDEIKAPPQLPKLPDAMLPAA